ncbi:MAG TPA: GNAT family N-acetyltransferase [Acidobacteriaceae bacterium]|jgi:ribosomal protein S18 acetylase RimI-like enzyme
MEASSSLMLRELQRAELEEAVGLLSRGMRDNPANVRAFAIQDADSRSRALAQFFRPVLHGLYKRGLIVGAFHKGTLAGVSGMAPPGGCQPTLFEKLRMLPSVFVGNPLGTTPRVLAWTGEWARRDPAETHWHLGPLAVDSHLQRQGIGRAMLADFCARVDQRRALSYLETDKFENVGFYKMFGFTVTAEGEVLGMPNWFMSRPSQ